MELITKNCPNCGAGIDTDCTLKTAVCLYCDSTVFVKRTPKNSDTFILCVPGKRSMSTLAKTVLIIFAIIGALFVTIVIIAISESESDGVTGRERNTAGEIAIRTTRPDANETYVHNLGDTFTFDDFEITFGDSIEWIRRDNYDPNDPNSHEYFIRIPITLTNNSGRTTRFEWGRLNVYGLAAIAMPRFYFPRYKDDIEDLRDMRDGAATTGMFLYFPYDGDAEYFIEINSSYEAKREIMIEIVKP
jgi:DNA-directed RNA polymerase subunit RPC12/RpoP